MCDCRRRPGVRARGRLEDQLEAYVRRRIQLEGTLDAANVNTATGQPTGGLDPLGQDLEIFEVEVEVASYHDAPVPQIALGEPPASAPATSVPERRQERDTVAALGTTGVETHLRLRDPDDVRSGFATVDECVTVFKT